MCRKVNCNQCGKATWAGCGLHIDSALRGVDESLRCPGWRTGKCTSSDAKLSSDDSISGNTVSNQSNASNEGNNCVLC
jgi:hypothetical protein